LINDGALAVSYRVHDIHQSTVYLQRMQFGQVFHFNSSF